MVIVKFGKREHCGGLKESLATSIYIDEYDFNELVKDYDYYGFDNRCNQVTFIAQNMKQQYLLLFIEFKEVN